jgi:hypothetical protein
MSYQDDNDRDNPSNSRSDRDRYEDGYRDDRDRDDRDRDDRYQDDRFQDDRDVDDRKRTHAVVPPPARGCSRGCLFGLAGCGCLTVVMIVSVGLLTWKLTSGFSNDPAVIRAATQQINEVNPPGDLKPTIKMDALLAKGIFYQSDDRKSSMSLLQFNPWLANMAKGQEKEFRPNKVEFDEEDLKIEKTVEQDFKIGGVVRKFQVSEAKNPAGDEYRIIRGGFPAKSGPIELQLALPLEKYNEEEVKKFLEAFK